MKLILGSAALALAGGLFVLACAKPRPVSTFDDGSWYLHTSG